MSISYFSNDRSLLAGEFVSLFRSVWKAELDESKVSMSLSKSINVTARDPRQVLVGCMRLVSDGYMSTHVSEVIINPEYRNSEISEKLLELAYEISPSGISFACQEMPRGLAEKLQWQKGPVSYFKRKNLS